MFREGLPSQSSSFPIKYLMMLPMLTYDPVRNPKNPTVNMRTFFINRGLKLNRFIILTPASACENANISPYHEQFRPWVTVSMIGGAMRARVELKVKD